MSDKLRNRIEAWLSSSNCNCSEAVYCTYCEILSDVLDYMDAQTDNDNESEKTYHVEPVEWSTDAGDAVVGVVQEEAGAGADPDSSGREEVEGPAEPEGVTDGCEICQDNDGAACDACGCGFR